MDDVIINKCSTLERCIQRVRDLYRNDERNLRDDLTKQDAIVLNLQRAAEACIDIAMHLVRTRRLGVPQESRDAFALLVAGGIMPADLGAQLQKMVGFRNVAVHDYQRLSLPIVKAIIEHRLDDLLAFGSLALGLATS